MDAIVSAFYASYPYVINAMEISDVTEGHTPAQLFEFNPTYSSSGVGYILAPAVVVREHT